MSDTVVYVKRAGLSLYDLLSLPPQVEIKDARGITINLRSLKSKNKRVMKY